MFEIIYKDIEENKEHQETIYKVLEKCFKEEKLEDSKLTITITLTDAENIRKYQFNVSALGEEIV